MFRTAVFVLVLALACSAPPARGADLTTLGAAVTIQSAIFSQGNAGHSGTVEPFLRIQANGGEQGFGTNFRPLEPDAVSTLVHSLPLTSLRRVLLTTPQGSDYYFEFHLDANESTTSGNNFLSVDQLRLYTAAAPDIATASALDMTGILRYNMDQLADETLLLDTALELGTGSIDLTIHVPTSLFADAMDGDYLYLFIRAGDQLVVGSRNYGGSGGFEEMRALVGTASSVEPTAAAGPPWLRVLGVGEAPRFRCSVPGAGLADIRLYDVRGRQVSRYQREIPGASVFEAALPAGPTRAASGIYFYRFRWNGTTVSTGKVTTLR